MLQNSPRPEWHERLPYRIALRLAGLALLGLAWWSAATLLHKYGGRIEHPPLEYLLAAIALVCAITGSGLTAMGHHLFDKIEVAARWSRPSASLEAWRREDDGRPED